MAQDAKKYEPWLDFTDCDYFRGVIGNVMQFAKAARVSAKTEPNLVVRFGLQGNGVYPNYQIELPGHVTAAFQGNGHNRHHATPNGYEEAHLSEERFNLQAVQSLLRICMTRAK